MNIKILKLFFISLSIFLIVFCNSNKLTSDNRIVVEISADVQTFNSLYAFNYEGKGELYNYPMIAKNWQWTLN